MLTDFISVAKREKRQNVNDDFSLVLVFYIGFELKLTSRAKPIGLTSTDAKSSAVAEKWNPRSSAKKETSCRDSELLLFWGPSLFFTLCSLSLRASYALVKSHFYSIHTHLL